MKALLTGVGQRIAKQRKSLGYAQEQLAELMDVSIQMISNLERGKKAIRIDNLLKLSRILHISTDYILTGQYSETDEEALIQKMQGLTVRDYKMIVHLIDYCTENN